METLIHKRVKLCQDGQFDRCICRMPSGWAVMGDVQFLSGYCLLLPDPVVPDLNAMTIPARQQFLTDMSILGDAVLAVTDAVRINYEMLGNLEPALHAHVFPRFNSEPEELKTAPVWHYDWQNAPPFDISRDKEIMSLIEQQIKAHHSKQQAINSSAQ